MIPVLAAALSRPAAAELTRVAGVFDQYRQHYGEPAVPGQTLAWLASQLDHGRLTVFTAHRGGDLAGLATTVELPASLRLSCSWQLRDLYVVPAARRAGVARAPAGRRPRRGHRRRGHPPVRPDAARQHRGTAALLQQRLPAGR